MTLEQQQQYSNDQSVAAAIRIQENLKSQQENYERQKQLLDILNNSTSSSPRAAAAPVGSPFTFSNPNNPPPPITVAAGVLPKEKTKKSPLSSSGSIILRLRNTIQTLSLENEALLKERKNTSNTNSNTNTNSNLDDDNNMMIKSLNDQIKDLKDEALKKEATYDHNYKALQQSFKAEKQQLEQRLFVLRTNYETSSSQLESQVESHRRDSESLRKELEMAYERERSTSDENTSHVIELQSSLDSASNTISQLQNELQHQRQSMQLQCSTFKEKLDTTCLDFKSNISQLQHELSESNKSIKSLGNTVSKLEAELQKSHTVNSELELTNQRLKSQLAMKENEIDDQVSDIRKECVKEFNELNNEYEGFKKTIESERQELASNISHILKSSENKSDILSVVSCANDRFNVSITKLQQEVNVLERENKDLQQKLRDTELENTKTRAKLQASLESSVTTSAAKEQDKVVILKQLHDTTVQFNEMKDIVADYKSFLSSITTTTNSTNSDKAAVSAYITNLKDTISDLNATIVSLKINNSTLEEKLDSATTCYDSHIKSSSADVKQLTESYEIQLSSVASDNDILRQSLCTSEESVKNLECLLQQSTTSTNSLTNKLDRKSTIVKDLTSVVTLLSREFEEARVQLTVLQNHKEFIYQQYLCLCNTTEESSLVMRMMREYHHDITSNNSSNSKHSNSRKFRRAVMQVIACNRFKKIRKDKIVEKDSLDYDKLHLALLQKSSSALNTLLCVGLISPTTNSSIALLGVRQNIRSYYYEKNTNSTSTSGGSAKALLAILKRVRDAELQRNTLQEQYYELQNSYDTLSHHISHTLTPELESKSNVEIENQKLREDSIRIKDELALLLKKKEDLHSVITELQSTIESLKQQYQLQRDEKLKLQRMYQEATNVSQSLTAELESQQSAYHDACITKEASIVQKSKTIVALEASVDYKTKAVLELEVQKKTLEDQLGVLKTRLRDASDRIDRMEEEVHMVSNNNNIVPEVSAPVLVEMDAAKELQREMIKLQEALTLHCNNNNINVDPVSVGTEPVMIEPVTSGSEKSVGVDNQAERISTAVHDYMDRLDQKLLSYYGINPPTTEKHSAKVEVIRGPEVIGKKRLGDGTIFENSRNSNVELSKPFTA